MKQISLFLCLAGIIPALVDGQDRDQRIADLERQLTEAKGSVAALQKTIDSLATEVQALRQPGSKAAPATAATTPVAKETSGEADVAEEFAA